MFWDIISDQTQSNHEDDIHILHPSERLKGTEYGIPRDVLRGYFESDQTLSPVFSRLWNLPDLDLLLVLVIVPRVDDDLGPQPVLLTVSLLQIFSFRSEGR